MKFALSYNLFWCSALRFLLLVMLVVQLTATTVFGDPLRNPDRDATPAGGEALLPLLRLDAGYQWVRHDVEAKDVRVEVGYGPLAAAVHHTRYEELQDPDTLKATQVHLLYRMAFGSVAELDLGMGALSLTGAKTSNGFSWTLPLLIYPTEHGGFELHPSWSNLNGYMLQDYDLGFIVGLRHLSLKLGYRWLLSEHKSLVGPKIGVVARW